MEDIGSYAAFISVVLHLIHGSYIAFHHCKLRSKCCDKESEISFAIDQESPKK